MCLLNAIGRILAEFAERYDRIAKRDSIRVAFARRRWRGRMRHVKQSETQKLAQVASRQNSLIIEIAWLDQDHYTVWDLEAKLFGQDIPKDHTIHNFGGFHKGNRALELGIAVQYNEGYAYHGCQQTGQGGWALGRVKLYGSTPDLRKQRIVVHYIYPRFVPSLWPILGERVRKENLLFVKNVIDPGGTSKVKERKALQILTLSLC